MEFPVGTVAETQDIIAAALHGEMREAQAKRLAALDSLLVQFILLAVTSRVASLQAELKSAKATDPSTPSGQLPIYTKQPAKKRKGKPGAKPGHTGACRKPPPQIDRHEDHRLAYCPDCGGPLQRCQRSRKRVIVDIPTELQPEATEHTIHRDYCPVCKNHVEPIVVDALPKSTIGHRAVALTSWLHYGLGVTVRPDRRNYGLSPCATKARLTS